ncbi:MAG: hypothetical protein JXB14_02195 [Candidatus Altiarchaeota archaeon]|nr:hypothetical protein [Candidatus Altiarchaeota archaeon]
MITGHKKVHIVPVAFEIDRAVKPVFKIGADKVYILSSAGTESDPFARKVQRQLSKPGTIEVVMRNYALYDYDRIMKGMVEIARAEKGNDIFINLSSGGHDSAIAGALVASMFHLTPYYAIPEVYNIKDGSNPEGKTSGLKDLFEVPTYPVESPRDDWVRVLGLMGPEWVRQRDLIKLLGEKGLMEDVFTQDGKTISKKGYMQFRRRYLESLLEREWIEKEGRGRSSRVRVTEQGKKIAGIFG